MIIFMYRIAVTNRHLCEGDFLERITTIAEGTVYDAILLREKDLDLEEYTELAERVIAICKRNRKKCILHHFPETALRLKHPYVHLPLNRWEQWERKEHLRGAVKEIGTSVHSLEQAEQAVKLGADYVTAGHIFPTDCKKGLEPRGLGFLEEICRALPVPVYGIGGIKRENEKSVTEHGAAGVCIMSGCMRDSDEFIK